MYGECSNKMTGGGECKAGFEVKWEGGGSGPNKLLASLLNSSSQIPDAAQFAMDISGSTIPYPSSGTGTVFLKNSATGTVVAARSFNWIRSGNIIRAQSPDAINSWAYSNIGNSDSVSYELSRFNSNYGPGLQTIASTGRYEGTTVAAHSATFYGGRDCIHHPSPLLCRDD